MNPDQYNFDAIIFDCDGTLVDPKIDGDGYTVREDIAYWVKRFYGKIPLAVASGGLRDETETKLQGTNLRKYFDVVITVSDVSKNKPAPDLFNKAQTRLGITKDQVVIVEDSEKGMEAAKRAGMRAIHISDADLFFRRAIASL